MPVKVDKDEIAYLLVMSRRTHRKVKMVSGGEGVSMKKLITEAVEQFLKTKIK